MIIQNSIQSFFICAGLAPPSFSPVLTQASCDQIPVLSKGRLHVVNKLFALMQRSSTASSSVIIISSQWRDTSYPNPVRYFSSYE